MNTISKFLLPIFFISCAISCTYDKEEITPILIDNGGIIEEEIPQELCDSIGSSFAEDILPLINDKCSPCHTTSNSGGHTWTNYDEVFADKNLILSSINHEESTQNMPQGGDKLSEHLINTFDCWIINGALDN